jgi:hypothetical protein
MSEYTKEQLQQLCRDVCPRCDEEWPLEMRQETGEYVHTRISSNAAGANNFAHVYCMATHLRVKYKAVFDE